jgi:RNA polymerase sigma factor (sigma-70 family)
MDWSELEAVYERYHQQLYRYCYSIVGNADDAQDALQNAMLKAVRALPAEQREIQLKPWLYRIAHNESVELLRKRRDQVPLGPDLASPAGGLVETATQRDRLRQLLGDLDRLPERQRGALVMRELSGLGFEQIGEAFETSPAVARQTVYEARLSLRQLEAGREMSCEKVMLELSDADGRVTRRRDIQAHLRDCAECREFGESIASRRRDLAAIAPLPAAASTALLHSIVGGGKAGAGLGGSLVAGVGKTAAGSVALKSAATVAVVAVLGASIADRSGLVDLPGSRGDNASAGRVSGDSSSAGSESSSEALPAAGAQRRPSQGATVERRSKPGGAPAEGGGAPSQGTAQAKAGPTPGASGGDLPAASDHGQETAAAHGGGRAQAGDNAGGAGKGRSTSHPHPPAEPSGRSHGKAGSQGPAHGNPKSPGGSASHPGTGASPGAHPAPPANPGPPQDIGPDNSAEGPLQSSENPQGQGPPQE